MYVARHVAVGMQLFTTTAARIARTCAAGPPHAGKNRIKRGMFRPDAIPPPRVRGKRFNYVLSTDRRDSGFLFFIDDYQFERI